MSSEASGWSHIRFDELSIVNQAIRFISVCYREIANHCKSIDVIESKYLYREI